MSLRDTKGETAFLHVSEKLIERLVIIFGFNSCGSDGDVADALPPVTKVSCLVNILLLRKNVPQIIFINVSYG